MSENEYMAAAMGVPAVEPEGEAEALPGGEENRSGVQRDEPQPEEARKNLVSQWSKRIQSAKQYHDTRFKQMRRDMKFVRGLQWEDQTRTDDERYVANLTLRHLNTKVASLYAKNPKAQAQRRPRLEHEMWDGNPQTMMQAQQTIQMAMEAPGTVDPGAAQEAEALLADIEQGNRRREQIERIGRTLELVYQHQIDQQQPKFKKQMKQLVRRTATTGVGYIKLGFYRTHERSPDQEGRITDIRQQLAVIEQRMEDLADEELQETEAEAEELRQMLDAITQEEGAFVREGLDLDFPTSTSIIIDPQCRQLDGFIGARWVAQEYLLSPDQVQQHYDVDVKSNFRPYRPSRDGEEGAQPDDTEQDGGSGQEQSESSDPGLVCVWEVYDRQSGLVHHLADGYPDFLRESHAPICKLERFFPIFVLTLNEIEDESQLFPPSDIQLIRAMQQEHNISRQRMREHRDASRPKHAAPRGKLSPEDKRNLQAGEPHSVVELDGMQPGDNIQHILQPVPVAPIDPNLYEVGPFFDDILKAAGTQEANMGGTSGATATETSTAEASRQTEIGSNVDDLDDFLTEVAENASYILLTEMSADKVREIAGPGAVWPELTADEIARDLWLTVRAGSSGKPNKAQEIQNFERLAPILMQVPGVSPEWMAREAIERLDDRIELEEAFAAGMPSITAMNHQTQPDRGEPGESPNDQGAEGQQGASRTPAEPQQSDANQGPNPGAQRPPNDPAPV